MQPFQQRVIDEKRELDEKRAALFRFLASSFFRMLPEIEQGRLYRQNEIMSLYSSILRERIGAFT